MPPTNKIWHIKHQEALEMDKRFVCLSETAPHIATLLSFPSARSTFPELHLKTRNEIISLATTIAAFEPVRLHARPEDLSSAQALLAERKDSTPAAHLANITLIPAPTNHCWIRDTGPVYVRSADTADTTRYAIDFHFCEWGHKINERIYGSSNSPAAAAALQKSPQYADWPIMDEAATKENTAFAAAVLGLENESAAAPVTRVQTHIKLEGGGMEVDGEGTFMATESSIIGDARNPGLGKAEIEAELSRLLGVSKFVWFPGRIGLDVTDVHIDAEARFIRPGVVIVSQPHPDAEKVHWEVYEEIRAVLEHSTDARGRKFEVHDVVKPNAKLVKGHLDGEEVAPAASYVNFYFVNGGLVMPAFGDVEADKTAFELIKSLVPEREVKQVDVNALPRTGGVLHCVTQQIM
jgi:agmatine deiminase